ncbi:MAG: putative toxin-antitoxin system toxin component, PIN family [Terriglobales bacterium]
MRIVADTNVIVSALVFGGVPRRVLELADSAVCELFYSEAIQVEVRRVLLEKFDWSDAKVDEVLSGLWRIGELANPRHKVNAVFDDPDDNRILECALSASAAFVVSGDRHLLRLRRYKSISIVSPREFLETSLGHED